MATYYVGTIASLDGASYTNFLYQSISANVESDEYTANDANGNIADIKNRNYRATVSINAIIPVSASIPVTGMKVGLKGITLPTVTGTGKPTGGISFNSTATSVVNFRVNGTPSVTTNNTDYMQVTLDLIRHLNNNLESTSNA